MGDYLDRDGNEVPTPEGFTDPFFEDFDDEIVAKSSAEWERLLSDANSNVTGLDALNLMDADQLKYIESLTGSESE